MYYLALHGRQQCFDVSRFLFLLVDTNQNEKLSLQELYAFLRIEIPEPLLKEDKKVQKLEWDSFWTEKIIPRGFAIIDLDRDEQLSFEEVRRFEHTVSKFLFEETKTNPMARILFFLFDAEENDKLSLQELSASGLEIPESLKELESLWEEQIIPRIFAIIDLDRDDQLSFAEIQNFPHKILKIVNEDPNPMARIFFLLSDTDGNDKLSLQELSASGLEIPESLKEQESFWEEQIIPRSFAIIDLDRDDQLSFAEVQNFSDKVLKIVNEDPKFIFTKMILLIADTDGTDNLTFQELSSLQDFFAKILFSMADILDILILPGPNLTAKFMLSYIKQ